MDHDTAHDSAPVRTDSSPPTEVGATPDSTDGVALSFVDDAEYYRADVDALRARDDLTVSPETTSHETFDHCGADIEGRTVVAVENEDGELLVLCNDEIGVAILPHGDVMPGEDWARVARESVESLTGLSIALDGVELLRDVDHVVDSDGKPHRTTYRLILRAHPVGGEIQDCKQCHEAGSDAWAARWVTAVPHDVAVPEDGPGDDITYVFDCGPDR